MIKIYEQKKYFSMECYREPSVLRSGTGQEKEWFWEMQGENSEKDLIFLQ